MRAIEYLKNRINLMILYKCINMLLTVFSGAALATAARLKWDPSTYVVLRALFPLLYSVTAAVMFVVGMTLISLGLLSVITCSFKSQTLRRSLLFTHAAIMSVLVCVEGIYGVWIICTLTVLLKSKPVQSFYQALTSRGFNWLMDIFLPSSIKNLIDEVKADVLSNVICVVILAVLLAVLQLLAIGLAIYQAKRLKTSNNTKSNIGISLKPIPGRKISNFIKV